MAEFAAVSGGRETIFTVEATPIKLGAGYGEAEIDALVDDLALILRESMANWVKRENYPHRHPVATRWAGNDVYGHVNNVEYYAWFDTAINAYLIGEGGLDVRAGDTIGLCVESHCEYRAPVAFPETVEVGLRVATLGRTSVRYELAIFRDGVEEPTAVGWFVHVFVGRDDRRPTAIPRGLRAALARLEPAR